LVYRPHPETKPEHFQDSATLEILTAHLEGLDYGDTIVLELPPEQIRLHLGPRHGHDEKQSRSLQ
jgi:hypothetical protein